MTTATNKPKTRGSQQAGIYRPDSIKDVAESLGISVSDNIASALASDVEYRIYQVIEEAARFMRHGRRATLSTADVENALRVLNIEPLYGHTPSNPPSFRRALSFSQPPAAGPVYFVEDEEIDFDRVLREDKIALPKGVGWTAHWLAVEGVQPLIPENPPAIPKETDPAANAPTVTNGTGVGTATGPTLPGAKKAPHALTHNPQLVKQVLSRELQLYYARLTSSLLPPTDFARRTAALGSLRHDAGLQALLPYIVRWVGEGVVGALRDGAGEDNLDVLLDVIGALMENQTLFVEPYLHQLLPPILSTLLHSSLPPNTPLRTTASQILSRLLTQHSTTYPSLSPRIMKTLLLALVGPGKSKGTRAGAVRGLMSVGREAVRKSLVLGGGARVIASECVVDGREINGEATALVSGVMDALRVLRPSSDGMSDSLDPHNPSEAAMISLLNDMLGDFFATRVAIDRAWAEELLGEPSHPDQPTK